ncbi:hypothetical protein KY285_016794 [Solanum tuberosum]|nr:hypothetical protein KY284_016790 [Solanum tuberosum]KAH0689646.1 hypothetical protein KY289_017004 [Solanum tuberosum]KAH0702516.1 hypothetical protein KY285_016794 [Solanum tuberosum]
MRMKLGRGAVLVLLTGSRNGFADFGVGREAVVAADLQSLAGGKREGTGGETKRGKGRGLTAKRKRGKGRGLAAKRKRGKGRGLAAFALC